MAVWLSRQCLMCQRAFLWWHDWETWLTCLWKIRNLSNVTPRSFTESDRWTVDPATSIWEMLDKLRFHWLVPRRIASDVSGFQARQLRENHWDRTARADSSLWRLGEAEDWEIEMKSNHQHIGIDWLPCERGWKQLGRHKWWKGLNLGALQI